MEAKGRCEAAKAARKGACEARKTAAKAACEAEKEAKRIDCERLKTTQITTAEPYEAAIHRSKQNAIDQGLRKMPQAVRQRLGKAFSPSVLDRVRYVTSWGDWTTIQTYALKWNDKSAIVFDYIIVFKSEADVKNVALWAHELEHVKQYQLLGIDGFAQAYMHKETTIESNAERQAEHVCAHYNCSAID
ncbi:DUF4157 domain-containing protein [Rhizobium phaseoli]|uniref:DUF4157 domain-containing protein n=1 Tax=Rhizobium phaseoli TaxID=396 RepID=UPI0007EBFEB1|nr:DUF4157 domain-containing protein [Rhizobium phaseoli]